MRTFLISITSLVAVVLGYLGANFTLFNYKGGHGPFRAQDTLHRMHQFVKFDADAGWTLPEPVEFNRHLSEAWEMAKEGKEYDGLHELPYDHAQISISMMESSWHHLEFPRWSKAPIYIVDDSLPDGFGFYLEGQDGISESRGKDPDDINSWDRDSHRFYYRQRWRREQTSAVIIGLAAGGFVFLVLGLLGPRNRRFS